VKYGILGDIHGNLEALEVVLEDMEKQKVDEYISVGDIVGYGANPHEVIEALTGRNTTIISGNHDQAICGQLSIEFFNSYARASCFWTQKQLKDEEIKFLEGFPLVKDFGDFIVTHSSLYYPENFEYIQNTYDAHLSFEHQDKKICFIGHSHIPIVFYKKKKKVIFEQTDEIRLVNSDKILINVGAVGQPRDENPDAVCAVYDADEKLIRLKRLHYDVEKAAMKIKEAGLPDILAERLKYGR
jgi:predicted phosphodiesterase